MIVKTSPIYRLQLLPRPCLHRVLPGLVFAGLRSRLDLIMTTRDRGLQDGCDVACISIDNTPLFHVPTVPRCRRGAVVSAVVIIACYYTPLMRSLPQDHWAMQRRNIGQL